MCAYAMEQIKEIDVFEPADYPEYTCDKFTFGKENVYVQVEGDQSGYYSFPTTPYVQRLEVIELRGNSLEDGFRTKSEYQKSFVSPYGYVVEDNVFAR